MVISYVTVLTPAAHCDIDRGFSNFFFYVEEFGRSGKKALLSGYCEFGGDAAIEVLFHEGPEIIRVVFGQELSLPVKAFVHVKYGDVA